MHIEALMPGKLSRLYSQMLTFPLAWFHSLEFRLMPSSQPNQLYYRHRSTTQMKQRTSVGKGEEEGKRTPSVTCYRGEWSIRPRLRHKT